MTLDIAPLVLPLVVLVVRGMFHLRPAVSAPPEPLLSP